MYSPYLPSTLRGPGKKTFKPLTPPECDITVPQVSAPSLPSLLIFRWE